jgi:hypothetical protein
MLIPKGTTFSHGSTVYIAQEDITISGSWMTGDAREILEFNEDTEDEERERICAQLGITITDRVISDEIMTEEVECGYSHEAGIPCLDEAVDEDDEDDDGEVSV